MRLNDKSNKPIPEPIVQLQRQLDQFRSSHAHRARIPEALWRAAVELAGQHGLNAVAHPLRLDYMGLKRRLGRRDRDPRKENVSNAGIRGTGCALCGGRSGVRDRVRVSEWRQDAHSVEGLRAPDWGSLLRAWREAER